ncbi:hypothetical protein [Methanobrevibacter sp. UBA212]|uniref:hypothetical protein n=1 Tax=Methanobrevibacter sp. UBA212 TaxID=1915476 RepID=UPI0026000D15|nr:hypothetical protein [Methanobrevibacter sp. UBA212]
MKIKSLLIIFLIFYVIISCSLVFANDNITNNISSENIINQQQIVVDDKYDDSLFDEKNSQEEEVLDCNDSIEIYVGMNKTSDGGNGSYNNPYATLDLACKNVNGENKATINIFNGTYYLGSLLKFNTSNLFINGINGDVIIRNEKDNWWDQQAFSLQSPTSNFTMKNIIFNSSVTAEGGQFTPFIGTADYGTYINCTFKATSCTKLYGSKEFNSRFINCIIRDFENQLFRNSLDGSKFVYFENCIFLNSKVSYLTQTMNNNKNISINGVWFGENKIAEYVRNIGTFIDGNYVKRDIPIIKYAIFSVYENYLGDNQYEIVGRLTWNGTNSSEGMENFPPMTVTITSTTGRIQSTVTLINGSFKANYTSNSLNDIIVFQLDYQKIKLNFNTVDIQTEPVNIYYGDNQNVILKFNKLVSGFLNITVNNKTYDKIKVDNTDLFVYTIKDILTEGIYPIQIVLYNNENTVHGLGSSMLIVSKVLDYDFIPIIPSDAKVGVNKISFEMPYDATGIITIFLGEKNFTIDVSNTTEILIDGFVEGKNLIKIIYSNDNKYVNQSVERIITAEKFEVNLENNLIFTPPSGNSVGSFIFNLPTDVEGNLTVNVNGKNYTQTLVDGKVSINIDDLPSGSYEAIIYYSGNCKFYPSMINESFLIPKPILSAQDVSIQYTSSKMYIVKVTRGGKPITGKTVTINVNGGIKIVKTDNNGYASVKINLPPKSKAYTISANYLGVIIKNKITVKSIVVAKNLNVKKTAKKLKIKVTLKKVDNKYLKGKQVSLKFNGKTYKAKTNKKGVATFTIKNKVIKKLKVGKKYTYKVTYLKETSSKKITVKK